MNPGKAALAKDFSGLGIDGNDPLAAFSQLVKKCHAEAFGFRETPIMAIRSCVKKSSMISSGGGGISHRAVLLSQAIKGRENRLCC